jgi:hypothetical protein
MVSEPNSARTASSTDFRKVSADSRCWAISAARSGTSVGQEMAGVGRCVNDVQRRRELLRDGRGPLRRSYRSVRSIDTDDDRPCVVRHFEVLCPG